MIQIESLDFSYTEASPIFKRFSWRIKKGESWAILGPSGCGKSTLLYLLAGLQMPHQGNILIDGNSLQSPRPKTGLVLQDYGLLPWATVEQNISLGLRIRKFYGPDGKHAPSGEEILEIEKRSAKWIERLGLSGLAQKFPGQVSGGQRQRAAIARTLATQPDILLMDEPFGSLDAPTRKQLQDLVFSLQQEEKLTSIYVTHAIESAIFLGQKILLLGNTPQQEARVIENPGAGKVDFILNPDYADIFHQLQSFLEQAV